MLVIISRSPRRRETLEMTAFAAAVAFATGTTSLPRAPIKAATSLLAAYTQRKTFNSFSSRKKLPGIATVSNSFF
jgi:hypothetical protein